MTVPLFQFHSGKISIVNGGSLNIGNEFHVETDTEVTLEVDASGSISVLAQGISVVKGRLNCLGQVVFKSSLSIAADAEVYVNAISTLQFSEGILTNLEITGGKLISEGNTTLRQGTIHARNIILDGYFFIEEGVSGLWTT